jgi:hypothetical protein
LIYFFARPDQFIPLDNEHIGFTGTKAQATQLYSKHGNQILVPILPLFDPHEPTQQFANAIQQHTAFKFDSNVSEK